MDNNIINKNRYKKITRNDKVKKNTKALKKVKKVSTYKDFNKKNIVKKENVNYKNINIDNNKNKKKKIKKSKILKIVIAIFVLVLITYVSRNIENIEDSPILKVFSSNDKNTKTSNYDFKIAINNLGDTNYINITNIVANEFLKKSNLSLLTYDKEYNIHYEVAKNIEKTNNKEYWIELKSEYKVSLDDIVNSINKIKEAKEKNVYYANLKNISEVKIENEKLKITLTSDDPYFIYSLNFPIYETDAFNDNNKYTFSSQSNENLIKYIRNDNNSNEILKSINITNYSDYDKMIEDFRNNSIDMFLSSSYNTMQLLGKHEYGIKKYRNGETVFLLGNKESTLFKQKEIRQALAYGINRDELIKKLESTYAELIDIPFIYSTVKYKYDLTGAKNGLIAASWKQINNNIYSKKIDDKDITADLKMLVIKDDTNKKIIAEGIKEMMLEIGININIEYLNEEEINEKIEKSEYDLLLTTLYIGDNPNIEYIKKYLNINEDTDKAFKNFENSDILNVSTNLQNLQNILSQEIACIGIYAKDTNVVYQTYVKGIEDIGYMKIFDNIDNISVE